MHLTSAPHFEKMRIEIFVIKMKAISVRKSRAFQATLYAMSRVGIPPKQREGILRIVAAVLNLGNIHFVDGKETDSSLVRQGEEEEALRDTGKMAD